MIKRTLAGIVVFVWCAFSAQAQEERIQASVLFAVNDTAVDASFGANAARLEQLASQLRSALSDSAVSVREAVFSGAASPEGRFAQNRRLAEGRRRALAAWVKAHTGLPDSLIAFRDNPGGSSVDWESLAAMTEQDSAVPGQKEALDILRNEPEYTYDAYGALTRSRKDCLMRLKGGRTWHYMLEHFFPALRRACTVTVTCRREALPEREEPAVAETPQPAVITPVVPQPEPAVQAEAAPKNRYWSLHTNLLYDALLVPNVGGELYAGRSWSVAGNWMYGWWDTRSRHRWWRVYGGWVSLRKWFGRRAAEKPLTGHHIGVYVQTLTYDFEFGGTGRMGGEPGGNIFDRASYAAGLEYGFALPVGRRLNLDFTIGAGYLGGTYYEYLPIDNHYVWQATKERHWFGPTRAEISLVWLFGRGNENGRKGGRR